MSQPRLLAGISQLILASLLQFGAACGSSERAAPEEDETSGAEAVDMSEREPNATPGDQVAAWNARARQGSVEDQMHGVAVSDPYRSLEIDSPETREWVDAQSQRTERALASRMATVSTDRLSALLSIGSISSPAVGGARTFFLKRSGDREQPALFVAESGRVDPEPLVDPLTYGERSALDWYVPSPTGRYVAFGISSNGDERSTLHILDVGARRVLEDRIPHTKWSALTWMHDESGFYYTRYPREGEPNYSADEEDTYYPRLFFHTIAANPDADPLVFGAERGTDFPSVSVSDDDRYVLVHVSRGWSQTDLHLFDRGAVPARRVVVPTTLVPVVTGREHITSGFVHRGKLYLRTNEDAPRYRIVSVTPAQAADRSAWRDVVPQSESAIEDWNVVGDRIVVHYIDDVRSRVKMFRLDGHAAGEVTLPTDGSVDSLAGQTDRPTLAFTFSSYLTPPTLLSFDVAHGRQTQVVDQIATDFDFSRFEVERVRVPSRDGTQIPVTIVHARDFQRSGDHPVIINAYGGFNVSLLPSFSRNALYWLERGGVFAVANLRGGAEYGEEWHQAGRLEHKANVFDDFEAVIRWFGTGGISRPDRIAITGGSNGGLLMGAMLTRCPDAFRATTTYVGLYDMVRYHRFPPAELWVSEYGSAEDAAQFPYLYAYSPYHRVQDGTAYPAALIETADHDSRVYWGHSTKFAARLQEANSGTHPIYFYMEHQVGHGAGTRLSDLVRRYARAYAFLEEELGVSPP